MAHSTPHNYAGPTGSDNDPFDGGAYDEPFSMRNLNHDNTETFVTYTSGTRTDPLAGPTQAESLAADYGQHNVPPSLLETPDRLPTPSFHDSTLPNPSNIMMNVPYRDDDSSPRPLSAVGKSDASLVHNAADMGRSSGYQDLGMQFDRCGIYDAELRLRRVRGTLGGRPKVGVRKGGSFQSLPRIWEVPYGAADRG